MVFELDTKDMERHAVELRLYMDRAKRRFMKAQMADMYEKIVKNQLPQSDQMDVANAIQIDQVSEEDTRRLSNFLDRLVDKCMRFEQHQALQTALRASLQQSRRKSVIDANGQQVEPICFFCAGNIPSNAGTNYRCPSGMYSIESLCNGHLRENELIGAQLKSGTPPVEQHLVHVDPALLNLPTPPPSNGAPTPQPQTSSSAASNSSIAEVQRSHTPPLAMAPRSQPVATTSSVTTLATTALRPGANSASASQPISNGSNASKYRPKRAQCQKVQTRLLEDDEEDSDSLTDEDSSESSTSSSDSDSSDEFPPTQNSISRINNNNVNYNLNQPANQLEDSLHEFFSNPANLQRASTPLCEKTMLDEKDAKVKPLKSEAGVGSEAEKGSKEVASGAGGSGQVRSATRSSSQLETTKTRSIGPIVKRRPKISSRSSIIKQNRS